MTAPVSRDGVQITVEQAFGPRGDNLVGISDVTFDGFPAVTLRLQTPDGRDGLVHLSPIHGDPRKAGFTDIEPGTVCTLLCPVSGEPLERVEDIDDAFGAGYYRIYRTPDRNPGSAILISDVWGHYHSKIVDDFEIISAWADLLDELERQGEG
ncbi:MAG: hypothetical protein R3F60_15045 [bacterium]